MKTSIPFDKLSPYATLIVPVSQKDSYQTMITNGDSPVRIITQRTDGGKQVFIVEGMHKNGIQLFNEWEETSVHYYELLLDQHLKVNYHMDSEKRPHKVEIAIKNNARWEIVAALYRNGDVTQAPKSYSLHWVTRAEDEPELLKLFPVAMQTAVTLVEELTIQYCLKPVKADAIPEKKQGELF